VTPLILGDPVASEGRHRGRKKGHQDESYLSELAEKKVLGGERGAISYALKHLDTQRHRGDNIDTGGRDADIFRERRNRSELKEGSSYSITAKSYVSDESGSEKSIL